MERDGHQLSTLLTTCEGEFASLVSYYCVTTPTGLEVVDPSHFFGLWSTFTIQFMDYWRQEKKNQARERSKLIHMYTVLD